MIKFWEESQVDTTSEILENNWWGIREAVESHWLRCSVDRKMS